MTTERECPECGEYTEIDDDAKSFQCSGCKLEWRINYDYSNDFGIWTDCTTLSPL